MDSQGAGFAFDATNMDFSNVFATKTDEGNTSNCFFFGDEGIDATTGFSQGFDIMNPALLTTTPLEQTYMPQLTMDNTSGSASMWNGQLTPQSQTALNSFPPTPNQSFDELYQTSFTNNLGKRTLQLDAQDFPQAKRQETADFSTLSSAWSLDGLTTSSPSAVSFGISDEAADMCATWFNKYAILPSDRHINSLSQLTGESAEAIRHWFGRLLKQGMGGSHGDSAYKSQTALFSQDQFWNDYSTDLVQVPQVASEESTQEAIATPEFECTQPTTVVQPANALRGGKKQRCSPTDDRSLLSRDPNKIYQCTRKCGKRYGRKCDWKRNEEEGYPCKSWVCSLCTSQGVENVKACFRKYHFAQHFRNIHPGLSCDDYEETSMVCSETEFPRQCGFCKHRFESRQERIDHIADHFKQGKCMLDWNDDGGDESHDSDNNDDNDDRPNGDGFDSDKPAYPPPPYDPSGGANSKYYEGGGNSGEGNGGNGSSGGYFQFQLSRSSDEAGSKRLSSFTKQHCLQSGSLHENPRSLRASSEPIQRVRSIIDTNALYPTRDKPRTTTTDNQNTLARDVLPESLRENATDNDDLRAVTIPAALSLLDKSEEQNRPVLEDSPQDFSQESVTVRASVELDANVQSKIQGSQVLQTIPATSQSFLSVKLLGSGGFSTVDEVLHRKTRLRLGRKTLKNRDSAAISELMKEVNVLQKLRHPHVIRFLGAYSKGDKMSILVSPVADTTLALWLERVSVQKPSNLATVVTKMFGCLASSVRYLHEQRPVIKHMDIKPQNVLVVEGESEFPHVVLCDFGISSSAEVAEEQAQPLTRHYVAPEVFEGVNRQQAADIWSLGCVFVEMASAPFSQSNSNWLNLRKEFSGRSSKYYWQDVPGLQDRLSGLLEESATPTETTVVRTIKSMLNAKPAERPDAASLTLIFTPAPCCLSWPNDMATYPNPRDERSSVETLLHEDGACIDRNHDKLDDSTSLDFANAKSWLSECSHLHHSCRHLQTTLGSRWLPTRLVDIRPNNEESYVRVIDSALIDQETDSVEYIALSHIWGQSDVTLTSHRLSTSETQLSRQSLSPVLNTAITAAQRLGHRYVWVDSLCIVQDDEDDKRKECANMASAFRNAVVTLVLDHIDNALDTVDLSLGTNGNFSKDARLTASAALPALDFATPGFAWDTRAWALQERLLSHRFLHLGKEQMYWECNSLKASDTYPQGLSSLVWEKAHSRLDHHGDVRKPLAHKHQASKVPAFANANNPGLTEHANGNANDHLAPRWKQSDGRSETAQAAQTSFKATATNGKNTTHTTPLRNSHAPKQNGTLTDCHTCSCASTPTAHQHSAHADNTAAHAADHHTRPSPSSTLPPLSSTRDIKRLGPERGLSAQAKLDKLNEHKPDIQRDELQSDGIAKTGKD